MGDPITFILSMTRTISSGKSRQRVQRRVVFLLDAPTSQKSVTNNYIDLVAKIVNKASLAKASVGIICAQRADLLSSSLARANASLKGMQSYIVQLTGGETQVSTKRPGLPRRTLLFLFLFSL